MSLLALTQQKLQKYAGRPSEDKFQPSESLERNLLLDRTFAYARVAELKVKEDFMTEMASPAVQAQPRSKRRWDGDDWNSDAQPSSPKKQRSRAVMFKPFSLFF
ncbi:hypothetical protein RMCBS344292_05613 [Rhizopus microsporus]|nr:hypothetical protein RMCBS344292_05613 [Rhizopus microsporus]